MGILISPVADHRFVPASDELFLMAYGGVEDDEVVPVANALGEVIVAYARENELKFRAWPVPTHLRVVEGSSAFRAQPAPRAHDQRLEPVRRLAAAPRRTHLRYPRCRARHRRDAGSRARR